MNDQAGDPAKAINTEGGPYIKGNVQTGDDFIGRDQVIQGDEIHGDKIGRDKVTISNVIANFFGGPSDEVRRLHNRTTMLKLVKDIWVKGVLERALVNQALIDLVMEVQPEAVSRPWDMMLPATQIPARHLLSDLKIANIFEEMNQSLLILGEPGSGKSTKLLELAKAMITKAEQDITQPIPVLFHLSSWANKHQQIAAWLLDELKSKYNIPQKVAQTWVEHDELLLLLDGLDEVKLEWRARCVEAINTFQQACATFIPIAVCCRTADYMALSSRLKLQGAVTLKPLTAQQIELQIERVERNSTIRQALQNDPSLQDLARSLLFLNTMILAYQNRSVDELLTLNLDQLRRQRLFDTYVQQMFAHQSIQQVYSPERTLHWLIWLAQQLTEHNQSIFLIEQMQPSWLTTRGWRWIYLLASRVLGGSLAGIMVWFVLFIGERDLPGFFIMFMHQFPPGLHVPAPFDGLVALVVLNWGIGFVVGLLDGVFFESHQRWGAVIHMRHWQSHIYPFMIGVVVVTLVMVLLVLFDRPILAFYVSLLEGISFVIGFGYLEHMNNLDSEIQAVEALSWSWREALKGGFVGVMLGMIAGSVMGLIHGAFQGFIFFLTFSLLFIALGGLRRNQLDEKLRPNQGMRLSLTNSLLAALVFGALFMATYSLLMPFYLAWSRAVLFILIGWLLYGGTVLMKHSSIHLLLWLNGCIPWNYVRFLDYCADRIFLRKVGGGYIFIHRLLMEHFAAMTEEDIKRLVGSD